MEAISERLETLEQEFARGERKLLELRAHEQELRETLLRLSGAIGVLKECLEADELPLARSEDAPRSAA
jgi:chromosome segregation ATPase